MHSERDNILAQLDNATVDVLVIGAGINGAVAAAALAGTGVQVALVDRGDFAGGVSSRSSNLAWGGIKYLESGELRLVRKLCLSRNRLMDAYPSSVREIRFFTSIREGFRLWSIFVWCGALLYWLMGNGRMAPPRYLRAATIAREAAVVNPKGVVGGLEYSDCYLYDNDSRFVFNFVRRALDAGALACNYVGMDDLEWHSDAGLWHAVLRDQITQKSYALRARAVINATGPAIDHVNRAVAIATEHRHVLSKGIHLIVDRVTDLRKVLTFFASDGRLFFVIPMGPKTCIGTTDTRVEGANVGVSDEDRDFVLDNANQLLNLPRALTREDIIAERVGVRPLAIAGGGEERDWVQLSRKHEIEVQQERNYLSIFGGKLTDCINVGDELVQRIADLGIAVPNPKARWYGEPSAERREAFMAQAAVAELDALTDPTASEPLSLRFWRRYGEHAFALLEAISADPREAEVVMPETEYTRAELRLTAAREMIVTLDDFLRRRSKIAQVVRGEAILRGDALEEAARLLLGAERAEAAVKAYREGPAG